MIPRLVETVSDSGELTLDLFVGACGYESRAICVSKQLVWNQTKRKVAIGFTVQQVLKYEENKKWFIDNGFEFEEVDDQGFRRKIDLLFRDLGLSRRSFRVGFDISCLNRSRIAHIVDSLRKEEREAIDVFFFYVIARFNAPPGEAAPTVVIDPVIPEFAGWPSHPGRAPAALIGLGYEPLKAVGVIEHLEIGKAVWVYLPISPISEYLDGVREANEPLLKLMESDGRQVPYTVTDPASLFHEMNSLVDVVKMTYNPLVIPFGPKIFALVSLLVASMHDEVGVWRVSASILEQAIDRQGSEHGACLHVQFGLRKQSF